jgi:hypothetical protein
MKLKDAIIEIVESNTNTLFPTQAPEEIADQIIKVLEVNGLLILDDKVFLPPSKNDAIDYIVDFGLMDKNTIPEIRQTAEQFIDYYESVNWKVGKSKKPMKSWKKALNNWCSRDWNKKSQSSKVDESVKAYMLLQKQKKQ